MILVDAIRLCVALSTLPDVPPERSCSAAVLITIAADEFDPLLVASIAYGESRFLATAHNPRTGCGGTMGVKGFRGDELAGYRAGVVKLRQARGWCARRGTPTRMCELAAYASGPAGPRRRLYRQPRVVLRRLERLRRAMPTAAPSEGS